MTALNRRQAMALCTISALSLGLAAASARAEEGEGHGGPPKPSFLPLGDFTVNLHDPNEQYGFVVVGVTIEVTPEAANTLKDIMPRLKDAMTRRLMALAGRGALTPGEADPEALKASLSEALQKVDPDGIKDVLITRLLYG
jgi:flagellar basal body-associated protein FliL